MKDISVVIPVLNEQENIVPLYERTLKVLQDNFKSYEIIYVDDGSTDRTFQVLNDINSKSNCLKVIRFRRNFGKAAGLSAGFAKAEGKYIVTMDGDLQDDPAEIPKFIKIMEKGYDMVTGWKTTKHKGSLRTIPSRVFNYMARKITKVKLHDFNCPFKAYRNEVVKDISLYGEMHRYIPVLVHGKGYRIAEVRVANYPRRFGKTKYGTKRILKGMLDLITVKYLTSYKSRPLHAFGTLGVFFTGAGFLFGVYLFILWLMKIGIGKRPLLTFSVLLMVLGFQFISLGLLGEMVANNNARTRSSYSIRETLE
jgi:glycosyltransferase involved in cell wall biosynthesis